jgi:hypothetical protein
MARRGGRTLKQQIPVVEEEAPLPPEQVAEYGKMFGEDIPTEPRPLSDEEIMGKEWELMKRHRLEDLEEEYR